LSVAQKALEEIVTPWAEANGVPPYRVAVRYLGSMSQSSIGDNIRKNGTLKQFREWLAAFPTIPDEGYHLTVEYTSLSVRIVLAENVRDQCGGHTEL
jgi:hypothetical protein